MTIRRLRARLDRLTNARPASKWGDHVFAFKIDPELAKSLRDDDLRERQLRCKEVGPDGPLTDAEKEEKAKLEASNPEKIAGAQLSERLRVRGGGDGQATSYTKKLGSSGSVGHRITGDGDWQVATAHGSKFHTKRMALPGCGGGPLTDAEDAEEAQLTARQLHYRYSPKDAPGNDLRSCRFQDLEA